MTHEHHHNHGHACSARDNTPVVVGYARTPFMYAVNPRDTKKVPGRFANIDPVDMSVALVNKIIDDTGIDPAKIQHLILGAVHQEAEQGLNPGRNIVLHQACKLTNLTAGSSVDSFCSSSATAIRDGKNMIIAGDAELVLAGGMQSMSLIPMGGYTAMINPEVDKDRPMGWFDMGVTAEYLTQKYGIPREVQEQYALDCHKKVLKARARGYFKDEIVPIDGVSEDDIARADTNLETMAGLRTAFMSKEEFGGTVTPATSSPLTDGATMLLLSSKSYARENNLLILAELLASAQTGCEPEIMGIGPVEAVKEALHRSGLTMQDINERGVIEFNEAFAPQVLAVMEELKRQGMEINPDIVNIDGGALALGHPLGATGGRLMGHGINIARRLGKEFVLTAMCVGGGMGAASVARIPQENPNCHHCAPCVK
jgi:acetyl-CoA acyltransferase